VAAFERRRRSASLDRRPRAGNGRQRAAPCGARERRGRRRSCRFPRREPL